MRKTFRILLGAALLGTFLFWVVPQGCDHLAGNVPIRVDGRVVDQSGAPVAGVAVHAVVLRNCRYQLPLLWTGASEEYRKVVTTDQSGRFVIEGVSGFALLVPIEKEGYEQYRWNRAQFLYNGAEDAHEVPPDKTHPATFLMWKLGERRILSGRAQLTITSDGRLYEADLPRGFQRTPPTLDQGDVNFSLRPDGGPAKWTLSVDAVEGGLVETDERTPGIAPQIGYEPKLEYHIGQDDDATTKLERHLYIRRKAGLIYGWLRLQVQVDRNGIGDVVIDYRLSHDKNPNLQ